MDFVITLCDTPRGQECPDFGGMAVTAAWPLPDPAKFTGSAVERAALLNELYASLQPAHRDFHGAALRLARSHGDEGAPR